MPDPGREAEPRRPEPETRAREQAHAMPERPGLDPEELERRRRLGLEPREGDDRSRPGETPRPEPR